MNLVKVISTEINDLKQRLVKILRYGNSDVQTPIQATAYGLDSNPIKDMIAVYSGTNSDETKVIIGYLNKNSLADVGEYRTFATDKNGVLKFYTWMKADGTYEIGGNTNYAVKFNELKTEFNLLKNNFNSHLTEYATHIHAGGTISGSTGITTPSAQTNISNIDNAKNSVIKTI